MRLPVEFTARLARGLIILSLAGSLAACGMMGGGSGGGSLLAAPAASANGPQSDYPVLVGEPYQIAGQTYRPNDTMNYDEVGYLAEDRGAVGITGSHHTLPVPSYAEVTSLTTGRTILVRLERRGPMASNHLLALSPAALAQLDATAETPVRVRRVNPPEEQRTVLRAGNSAPLRMDTPMALVTVLRRRLPAPPVAAEAPVAVAVEASAPEPEMAEAPVPVIPAADTPPPLPPIAEAVPEPEPQPEPVVAPEVAEVAPPVVEPVTAAGFLVQVAAFSTEERARRAAAAIGGVVTPAGNLFRLRTGPFGSRAEAEASLANVRAAGYSDARILTGG